MQNDSKELKAKTCKLRVFKDTSLEKEKDLVELMKIDDVCDDCIFIGILSALYVLQFDSVLF